MKKNTKNIVIGFIVGLCSLSLLSIISKIDNSVTNNNISEKEIINGKTISFLGDSISTYESWSNNINYNSTIGNNAVWYNSSRLDSVDKTYWKKTIDDLNMELCVNNSWSGSEVCTYYDEVSAGCMNRSLNLHNDNTNFNPDIIVIYMGINDYYSVDGFGSYTDMDEIYNPSTKEYIGDTTLFAPAYATMLHKIVNKYNTSDIYCMNLLPIGATKETEKLSLYNNVIKEVAKDLNVNYIDLFNKSGINVDNISTYTFDGTHPTASGHSLISEVLKESLLENYKLNEE